MKVDYKKFKKLHENEHSTTFVHKDGHQIKVAHSKLDKQTQEEMRALPKFAEGGIVESISSMFSSDKKKKPKPTPTPSGPNIDKDKADEISKSFKSAFAHGGMVSHYAQGTLEEDDGIVPEQEQEPLTLPEIPNVPQSGGAMQAMPQAPTGQPSFDLGRGSMPNSEQPRMPTQEQFQNVSVPQQQEQVMPQQPVQQQVDPMLQQQQQMMNNYNMTLQKLTRERESVLVDYKDGHIDPQRFFHKQTDLGRASTAIGLLLGGIGQGLIGGENPAMKFLEKQIDADIEAQKAELGKRHNLLSANTEQFKNLHDATNMTKSMMYDFYAAKLKEAEARAADPATKQRAVQNFLYMQQKAQGLTDMTAQSQAARQMPPSTLVPHLVPKEQQGRVFEELQKVDDAEKGRNGMMKIMDDMAKLQTVSNRTMHPLSSSSQLEAYEAPFLAALKPIFNNFSDSDKKQALGARPKITDSEKDIEKKKEILSDLFDRYSPSTTTANAYFKPYGIDLQPKRSSVRKNTNTKGK